MLTDFVNDLSFEFSLLIKDSIDKSGICLLTALIQQALNKKKHVICINMEPTFTPCTYKHYDVKTIDVFDNYKCNSIQEKILTAISSPDSCVIFPSLSLFLLTYPLSDFGQLLRRLKENDHVVAVVALIHTDVLARDEVLSMTEYMFDSVINVLPPESELISSYYAHAKCLRRKASGKLENSDEYFSLGDDYSLNLVHASSSAVIKSFTETQSADVVSSLTFNLSLSDKERDAKNKLQLPYLKKESEKVTLLSKTSSSGKPLVSIGAKQPANEPGGKIYYHYDEADDFDEEDPDDDLEI